MASGNLKLNLTRLQSRNRGLLSANLALRMLINLACCLGWWHSRLGICPSRALATPVLACSDCSHAHLLATMLHRDLCCRACNGVGDLSGGILEIGLRWHGPPPPPAAHSTLGASTLCQSHFASAATQDTSPQHCTGVNDMATRPDLVPGTPSLS
jgi:hypothetical protein